MKIRWITTGMLSCLFAASSLGGPAASRDTIIVGSWQQPRTLLDYASSQIILNEIQLLYRPNFVQVNNFGLQPNPALVDGDLPTFANRGARLQTVNVKKGDPVFNLATFAVEPATAAGTARQLVVTARIKRGLKWDDGQPLTAHDFVFAWKKSCEKDSGTLDVTFCPLGSIEGASGVVVDYQAKDDTTLELTYAPNSVDPDFQLSVFGPEGKPLPEHQLHGLSAAALGSDPRATGGESAVPMGYGPYRMTRWNKGESISFEANPNWSGAAPKTHGVVYRFFTDATALVNALLAGDIDVTSEQTGLSDDQVPYVESLAKRGQVRFIAEPNAAGFEFLVMNYNDPSDKTLARANPVLGDFAVRKAIAMAVDRKRMVDDVYYGHAALVDQPQLPQMKSYNLAWGRVNFDPVAARKLLDDAGWKPGPDGIRVKNGVRAKLNYLTTSGSAPRQKSAQIIQANLKALGIDVATTFQPSSVIFSRDGIYGRNFDLAQIAWTFTTAEPGIWLFGRFACGQISSAANNYAGANLSGWCNAAVSNAATHQYYQTLDEGERAKDWEIIVKGFFSPPIGGDYRSGGYAIVPLHTRPEITAMAPGLGGVALDPTERFTWNVEAWTLRGE